MKKNTQTGMSLLEITVVLLVLIALAGLTMPYVAGTTRKASCDATDISMMNIKKVIMEKYYLDTLGHFPQDLSGLKANATFASRDYNLHYLISDSNLDSSRIHTPFDSSSAIGWRGPYLQNGMSLDPKYVDNNPNNGELGPNLKNYIKCMTVAGQPSCHIMILDSWGRPFVLQVVEVTGTPPKCFGWNIPTSEKYCARLVSAGFGSGPGILNADIETPLNGHRQTDSDDRILYLNVPTPPEDINISCNDY